MIKVYNNVFIEEYIKGIKLRPDIGQLKIYFTDRTAKVLYDESLFNDVIDSITKYGFIQVDNEYLNPYTIKGFENLEDGTVKVYFPDSTAKVLYLTDDGFEDLVGFFSGL